MKSIKSIKSNNEHINEEFYVQNQMKRKLKTIKLNRKIKMSTKNIEKTVTVLLQPT
jgi:hypothetical protein